MKNSKLIRLGGTALSILRFFKANKMGLFGLAIMVMFVLMATVGPNIVPLDLASRWELRFQPPSFAHLLGTDHAGRDIFTQLIHGSRDVILIALFAASIAVAIAIIVGSTSGFLGGYADTVLMRGTDILLTVPSFPVMMIFAVVLEVRDPLSIGFILGIWMWAGLARAIRSQILSLKETEFIEAAKLLNLGTLHILFRELVPHLMSFIIVNFVRIMRGALMASIGLMFLGVMPFSPTNWGVMLNMALFHTGGVIAGGAMFLFLAPLGAIILFQYGSLCLANALEERFNPRLREHE